ncbi:RNA polymerase sigma factor [Chelativorans sp. J32]|uniref:RNA polymerase sigma factor n=1 Tax=Chelativorans sp. J32 TaxID=935840 RepID=UPI0004806FC7|nr:RNA polymerase sigma factor [Chelativorans sp. J32]
MRATESKTSPAPASLGDMDLVARALAHDRQAFQAIMKQNNQSLYRIARAVIRDDAEAEDVVQEAYTQAFAHLEAFRGGSSLSTWLSRITINEALGRLRRKRRAEGAGLAIAGAAEAEIIRFPLNTSEGDPERTTAQRQILHLIEQAIDNLPEAFRTVFVARVLEGMSLEETAKLLDLRPQTVKTRLHRARALLRRDIEAKIGPVLLDAFPFAGRRCDRLTAAVLKRLGFDD